MAQQFEKAGYTIVELTDKMDVCVINTCTVTNIADKKSRQMLRKIKHQNPNSIIVAVGCYVQAAKEEISQIQEIDIALGNEEKKKIVDYIEQYHNNKIYGISRIEEENMYKDIESVTYTEKTRAVVKIQDGCNNFCSYCIIPYVRGRIRSRKPENIISEIQEIAKKGIQEIVITGIHIASYGKDFTKEYYLIDLLEELNNIDGIKRIRLGSLEPTLITEEFVKRLIKLEKVCDHFHLSLQSGCNKTLKEMNRHYTTQEFREIVKRLRKYYKEPALTTDIIVGFPGETDEDFNKTYQFLKEINFYQMHVFKYSPRKGTRAAKMPNQISGKTKEERSKKLIELSKQNQTNYINMFINKELEVLFEEKEKEYQKGHTKNYILVKVKTNENLENKLKKIKIQENKIKYAIGNQAM